MKIIKKTMSFVLAFSLAIALLPVHALAAENTITVNAGNHYVITNTTSSSVSIKTTSSSSAKYDYARYSSNGKNDSYSKDTTGYFSVMASGYTVISPHGSFDVTLPDGVTIAQSSEPALMIYTLSAGHNYRLSNSDIDRTYGVNNTANNTRTYDYVRYSITDTVQYQSQGSNMSTFNVDKGGHTDISIGDYDIDCYMPYPHYLTILTFTDSNGNILPKPSYPSINRIVPYNGNTTTGEGTLEYVYDVTNPGDGIVLPTEKLESVTNTATATSAVNTLTSGMTAAQKTSATGADLATLYAETAVSKAASKEVTGSEIIINAAAVKELETTAANTAQAVETALVSGGVSTGRYIANTVTLTTEQTGKITIKVDPDILTTKVDKIRVETPKYALTLKVSDLAEDLTKIVTISAESMDVSDSGSYALGGTTGASSMRTMVTLDLPGGHTTNPVTLSFPSGSGKGEGEAVVNESGAASASKYNPATVTMDGKVNTSGKYTVKTNEKDFTDIASKSAEMQNAIRYLASKGIINGTSETTFSPDGSISRAEIAALIVRALGKLDSTATASFADVTTADWYYSAAASSQKNGIIKGYEDNTFKGKNPIVKQEIVAVAARVLKNEMHYKEPANTQTYLAKYSDTVAAWAQPEVALATRENLIVYRVDGTFSGTKNMTRGDAAIIIYRLFQHIW